MNSRWFTSNLPINSRWCTFDLPINLYRWFAGKFLVIYSWFTSKPSLRSFRFLCNVGCPIDVALAKCAHGSRNSLSHERVMIFCDINNIKDYKPCFSQMKTLSVVSERRVYWSETKRQGRMKSENGNKL